MNQKLNETQRKLVEDNHNLIYTYLKSRKLSLDSVEDWYGAAAVGLCKAALAFNEDRGVKFTTLAYVCMDNEVGMAFRTVNKNVASILSIDEEIASTDGKCCIADAIPDQRDDYSASDLCNAINDAYNRLKERDRQFIDLIVDKGVSQGDIAKKYGVSQTTVSRAYNMLLKYVNEYINT